MYFVNESVLLQLHQSLQESPPPKSSFYVDGLVYASLPVIWTGAVSDAWDDPANWTSCGTPDVTREVLIPNVSPNSYPVLTGEKRCRSLEILPGATFIIAPGGNINYITGHAVFEATHGTAPSFAGLDKVNPSSVILSGMMMLNYMGWKEAAKLIVSGIEKSIEQKRVTYDFQRLMPGSTLLKCSEFGDAIIENM